MEERRQFGITPEDIEAFNRKQNEIKVYNHPVRNVKEQTFWGFANASNVEDCLTPEALALFSK